MATLPSDRPVAASLRRLGSVEGFQERQRTRVEVGKGEKTFPGLRKGRGEDDLFEPWEIEGGGIGRRYNAMLPVLVAAAKISGREGLKWRSRMPEGAERDWSRDLAT